MKTELIHDKFVLDVTDFELVWVEENTWFKDEFFLISSFPFEIDYDRVDYLSQFMHDNLTNTETVLNIKVWKDGKLEDGIMEIEEAGDKLRLTVRYGIEALPNWTKKLSELDLEVVLPEGGYMPAFAETIIDKTWPDVNYNFPSIHTKYYEGQPMFDDFLGIINRRVDGHFTYNTIDGANTRNYNIVYPLPYHLYVLKSVVEDAGYTLHGDVLTDPDLIDAIIYSGKKIIEFEGIPKPFNWIVGQESRESVEVIGWTYIETWLNETELNYRGSFNLQGNINDEVVFATIKLNGEIIFQYTSGQPLFFNFWFETSDPTNELTFSAISVGNGITGPFVIDATLTTLYLTDEYGEMLPFFANFSNVNLADKLPDMTVGDFFKFHKRLKNYDLDLRNGNEIWMNLVQNEVIDSETVDVTEFEPPVKTKKFEEKKSFLLRYEGDYDGYYFGQIYADKDGFQIDDFAKSDNTQEVSINGIPLPIETHDSIKTAVQVSDDASKLMLVKFSGVNGEGDNWTEPMSGLETLTLYINYWQRWMNFIIHAVKFRWTVKDHPNKLMAIQRKSKLFSFNNLLFVFTLNRRRKGEVEETEIEAYSTKV